MYTSARINVGGHNTTLKAGNEKFKKENDLIIEILEIIWLSEKDLTDEPFYNQELTVHWFWFDTLLWILIDRWENKDEIYSIFRWEWYNSSIDRLFSVKQFLLEVNNWSEKVKDEVDEIIK